MQMGSFWGYTAEVTADMVKGTGLRTVISVPWDDINIEYVERPERVILDNGEVWEKGKVHVKIEQVTVWQRIHSPF